MSSFLKCLRIFIFAGSLLAVYSGCTHQTAGRPTQPNIIFILCDDLGFGDTGPTFQNERAARQDRSVPAFATPQLDRLASEGTLLRNHYCAAPVCAPSRASLLLGVTQGHANVRDNQFDKALANNHTLASVLKQAGYATAAVGKWGLQGRPTGAKTDPTTENDFESPGGSPAEWPAYPTKRGFDDYFGYVRHVDGHLHYPKEDGKQVWANDREVSADLALCYTTDLFTARAKKWIVDQRATRPTQPFFMFIAYDTPHAKLQLPPCAYPEGGGLRGGVQWTGRPGAMLNTATGTYDGWMDPAVANATWDHDKDPATPEQPWPDVQKRYAAGVRRIDAAVGDLLILLKDLGIDDNTLVVFTSDNGPSRESYLKEAYNPTFFAGNGPFDGIKRDTLEGGVREPTLVRWPGRVLAGKMNRTPTGHWDWLATLADAAGVPAPAATDGVSLLPTLSGRGQQRPSTVYVEYFQKGRSPDYEAFSPANRNRVRNQMQSVLVDGFMGVRYDIRSTQDDFAIYDVEKDPQQARNLAADPALKEVQAKMKARVLQIRRPANGAVRPYDDAAVPAVTVPGGMTAGRLRYDMFQGQWPWLPDFRLLTATAGGFTEHCSVTVAAGRPFTGLAFTGYFHAATEGDYTFAVASDAGSTLFLHDARVIDDDFARTGVEATGTIKLAAGWHPLRLYSRHDTGAPKLSVRVSGPGYKHQELKGDRVGVATAP